MHTKLKEIRMKRGLTQNRLSHISGVNKRTLEQYESARRDISGANIKTLAHIALVLNVKIWEIIDDEETAKLVKLASKID